MVDTEQVKGGATAEDAALAAGIHDVPVGMLARHPENPRRGSIADIAAMIRENGWHGTLVVQSATGYIAAGNHRFAAALQVYEQDGDVPGLDTDPQSGELMIPCHVLDIDDERTLAILLADNRASDLATYDPLQLNKALLDLAALAGSKEAEAVATAWLEGEESQAHIDAATTFLGSDEAAMIFKKKAKGTGYSSLDVKQLAMELGEANTALPKTYRTPDDMKEQYETTQVRQIMLIMGVPVYEAMLPALKKVRDAHSLPDNTEAVLWLLETAGYLMDTPDGWKPVPEDAQTDGTAAR